MEASERDASRNAAFIIKVKAPPQHPLLGCPIGSSVLLCRVLGSTTVRRVKCAAYQGFGIPVSEQKLALGDYILENDRTMAYYEMEESDTLTLSRNPDALQPITMGREQDTVQERLSSLPPPPTVARSQCETEGDMFANSRHARIEHGQ